MAAYEETRLQPPQVFMSFRGAELRQSFISHLVEALRSKGVNVYVDRVELMGKDLGDGIKESTIALVILSKRYTESTWCLNELVKIKERAEEGKLVAIPIFYKVKPGEVKWLGGDFGSNLWNHVKHTSEFDKLTKWKEALEFISGILGLVFNEKSSEVTFVNRIIYHVQDLMRRHFMLCDEEKKQEENVSESSTVMTDDKIPPKHEVFINFRGAELRCGFVSHLVDALKRNGVSVYEEEEAFRKGLDLVHHFTRMEEKKIALVIFSSKYGESRWCLDELVKIKELVDAGKLIAIPIFYHVKPSEVTKLEGKFGVNFWKLWRTKRDLHVIKWMEALESIASRKGIYLKEDSSETEIITVTVANVKKLLENIAQREEEKPSLLPSTEEGKSTELPTGKGEKHETYANMSSLFGVEQRMEELEKKLEFDCNTTRIIGVVGMPGIGKTTLATMMYEKWNRKFTRCVPLLGIRKKSEDNGPVSLRKTLLEVLLEGRSPVISEETTHGSMKVELLSRKIFVLLDDVSEKKQLELLLGDLDWIKKGSKIVITTCDKSLLEGFADDTYVVPELNDREALQLFSYHAFKDHICSPTGTFLTLSRMFVDYARGHPLALKLLGMELYGKDEAHWASKLEMVTEESSMMFQDVWRFLTYQLNEKQKDVFLDIECFFKSEDEYFVRSLLDSGDPDSTDAVSEVKDLVNKFLVTISNGRVELNVPLYLFPKELGSSRWLRLWNYKDIINELRKMKISEANNVRGIFLDMSKFTTSMCLDISTFINMRNLRYMKIYDSCSPPQCEVDYKLKFPDGLEFTFEEVRYLHWLGFPLEELPPDFIPKNLVDLRLPYSKITRVWEGEKDTPRLKWVDLSHSSELLDLSALSKAENLQRLNLEGCTSLVELPVEIQNMKSLVFLNLRGCIRLWSLPQMNLISLKTLILSDCSNLQEFELISESVEFLHLDGTSIKELPPTTQNLQKLVVLNLKNCKMLECLPNCLGDMKALDELILSGCSRLKNLPDVKNSLTHLQILLLDGTGAKEMPNISCFTGSEGLASADMFLQPFMREWPCGVSRVSSLRRLCLSGNDFVSLQPDIGKLYNLKWLDVKQCKKLISIPMLPPRLQYFDAHGCDSLERVSNPITFSVLSDPIHATFNFSNCNKLDQDAKNNIISYTRWRSQLLLDEFTRYNGGLVLEASIRTCFPGWEVPAWFSHRASGSVLTSKLPPHWCDNKFIGIGLCAVIIFDDYHYNQKKRVLVKCNCEFKSEDGSNIRFSCTVGGWSELSNTPRKIVSSHVFVGFTSRMEINKISEEDDEVECVCTKTFIEFEVTDGMKEIKGCEVVKCGFTLVYAPEERGNMFVY